jgi:hypothetical protein
MQVSAMTNYDTVVHQSTNLVSWTPVHTNRGSFLYSIPALSAREFLRATLPRTPVDTRNKVVAQSWTLPYRRISILPRP